MELLCVSYLRRLVTFTVLGIYLPPYYNYVNNSIPEGNLFCNYNLVFSYFCNSLQKYKK